MNLRPLIPLGLCLTGALLTAGCGAGRRPPETAAMAPRAGAPAAQPPAGVFHRVGRGQTLSSIARTYGVPLADVVAANGIQDPDRIEAGAQVFIPGARTVLEVRAAAGPDAARGGLFRMPVRAPVFSHYGKRGGRMHLGVDLGAPAGSPVRAARDGVVTYAGSGYRGYGNLVIVDHDDGYQTLYAHNRRLIAKRGQNVRAGDVIARVGASGNATAPHLHFEIRRDGKPRDPALYLPLGG